MYIKLKYIRISLDIYQHLSYHAQNQRKGKKYKKHINYESTLNAQQVVVCNLY